MARIEIMSGTERRRRWSDEAKLRILAEADEPGARIGDVARRHDIHPGQIRLWRQSFSYADRPTVFLPVEITQEAGVGQASTAATRPAIVENWPSSGVATAAAIVSGEAPGRLAVTEMVGKSTLGSSETGRGR